MKNTSKDNIYQRDIWLVEFDPKVGYEIAKTRPAIVISTDIMSNLPIKVVVPITSWQKHFKIHPYKIKLKNFKRFGLKNLSAAECFQIKSFSIHRFKSKIGEIDRETLHQIHSTIAKIFNPAYTLTA